MEYVPTICQSHHFLGRTHLSGAIAGTLCAIGFMEYGPQRPDPFAGEEDEEEDEDEENNEDEDDKKEEEKDEDSSTRIE